MNRQYEISKIICNRWIPDDVIDRELSSLSQEEWNKQCSIFDEIMKKHVNDIILQDLSEMGTANNVDKVTVWVAYMRWLGIEYQYGDKEDIYK